jgi:hypothetical protein
MMMILIRFLCKISAFLIAGRGYIGGQTEAAYLRHYQCLGGNRTYREEN